MAFKYQKERRTKEEKELLKWNKRHFSLFHRCSPLDPQKKTSKNVADTTFNEYKSIVNGLIKTISEKIFYKLHLTKILRKICIHNVACKELGHN